jgi:glycerophosphoryl diester phosphodiesterase
MTSTLVIGHRGASAHRRENTVDAFVHAAELGADWVELDVRATADGALAVHHDPLLPDGRAVAEVRAADLPGHVPLLDAALDACGPMGVNVEVKEAPEAPVVAAVREWGGEVIVSSFDAAVVDRVRALDPSLATAQLTFLLDRPVEDVLGWIVERGHRWWHPYAPVLDADGVAAAAAAGLAVNTWTVDDPGRIAELAAWGVAGIVTNDIPVALGALGRSR